MLSKSFRNIFSFVLLIILCLILVTISGCQKSCKKDMTLYNSDISHTEALELWEDMRFGMFIHWGPVALKGTEIGWSRGTQVPVEEYDNLYKQFNPEKFDAAQWVSVAKEAGMKYIVLTAKHHDGFSLWDSKYTEYDIMASPFGRDVIRELSDECKKQGIQFCTYYSILDWYQPDYTTPSHGGPGYKLPDGQKPDMDRYVVYMKNQLRELIKEYGPLGILWFDGEWEDSWTYERGVDLYDYCRGLQKNVIINNRVGKGREGMAGTTKQDKYNPGDYDTPEQRIGAFNNQRPWETCMTICRQWAWKPDDNMKSFKECIRTLVQVAGGDGNLLFNVGPMPDGRIEPRQVERLKQMGQWLEKYGESIYCTNGGPFKPGRWGVSTHNGNKIYLHVFNFNGEVITLPGIDKKIKSCSVLTGASAKVKQTDKEIEIFVAKEFQQEVDTIVVLNLNGDAGRIKPLGVMSSSLAYSKKAAASNVYQNMAQFGADKAFDDDDNTRWATDSGTSAAWIEVDLGEVKKVSRAFIDERSWDRVKKFQLQYKKDNGWKTIVTGSTIGENKELKFTPVEAQFMRLNILEAADGPTIWEFALFGE